MAGTDQDVKAGPAARLGFKPGQIVIEFGYDEDVDEDFRESVEGIIGSALEDEDYDGVVDAALLWWRDGDGDLTDDLVDTASLLEDGGFVVLLTPGKGRPDRVEAFDVQEACTASGLTASGGVPVGEWVAQRLVGRR
ncbi:MAG TPA: DUF3052 domain-containing protein [Ornithinicoccus sp.]|nr:DUF3052 domain-containing protein [Ornithinicoccus sp.]